VAGLVLSLRPYEKFLVGGVVLQNGPKRASLRVQSDQAGVLRLSEALHPDEAHTPLTRAYYVAQALLVGDVEEAEGAPLLARLLENASAAFEGFAFAAPLAEAERAAARGAPYAVMRALRPLLPQEAALLSDLRFRAAPQVATLPAASASVLAATMNASVNHPETIG
jgi:flagellar protein FlbT